MKPTIAHEIELACNAGVQHPENHPFLLTPKTPNGHGILLVHGFSATPREMRPLADYLSNLNFTVCGVRLPGHGTSPEDLADRRVEEWLSATERGYQILRQEQQAVSAVGLSTGALLILQLSLVRHLERLVLLSPFLRLKHPLAPLAGALSLLVPYQHRQIEAVDQPFYYQRRPLKGIAQLNRLKRQARNNLQQVTSPTLILAAKGDKTVYPGTAERMFNLLTCPEKEYHCYGEEVPHALTIEENPCRMDVFQRTASFLKLGTNSSPTAD